MKRFNVILNKMLGYIVSARNNKIFVSRSNNPQNVYERDLSKEILDGSDILDEDKFAKELGELVIDEFGPKPDALPINFLVEPNSVSLSFLTSNKNVDDLEKHLLEQANKRLETEGLDLENVYFSYQKIAPFTYQFVAIDKVSLENYLAIAGDLELELASVTTWPLLLPRTLENLSKGSTFIIENESEFTVLNTEFGGVYDVESIERDDVEKLVKEDTVYVFDDGKVKLSDDYDVEKLEIANFHELFSDYFSNDLKVSQVNLLNLLPLPAEQKQSKALIYVGSTALSLLLVGGVVFAVNYANSNDINSSDVLSENENGGQEVVVEQVQNTQQEQTEETEETETTEEVETEEQAEEEQEEDVTEEFSRREYLRVKVLNSTQQIGYAGNTTQYLEGLGYDTVTPADYSEELTTTLIQLHPDFANYEDILREDLSDEVGEIEVTTDLEEGLDYNALIILGTGE